MLPDPLHPAIVHFPLVLAVLAPPIILGLLLVLRRDGARRAGARRSIWGIAVGTLLLLAATARLAIQTGEAQEDVVEEVVPHDAIEEHEEAAERLFVGSLIVLVLAGAGLLRGTPGTVGRGAAAVGSVVLLGLALAVGESGGDLVYEHGAASAYTESRASDGPTRTRDADEEGRTSAGDTDAAGRLSH